MSNLAKLRLQRGQIKATSTRFKGFWNSVDLDNIDEFTITQLKLRLVSLTTESTNADLLCSQLDKLSSSSTKVVPGVSVITLEEGCTMYILSKVLSCKTLTETQLTFLDYSRLRNEAAHSPIYGVKIEDIGANLPLPPQAEKLAGWKDMKLKSYWYQEDYVDIKELITKSKDSTKEYMTLREVLEDRFKEKLLEGTNDGKSTFSLNPLSYIPWSLIEKWVIRIITAVFWAGLIFLVIYKRRAGISLATSLLPISTRGSYAMVTVPLNKTDLGQNGSNVFLTLWTDGYLGHPFISGSMHLLLIMIIHVISCYMLYKFIVRMIIRHETLEGIPIINLKGDVHLGEVTLCATFLVQFKEMWGDSVLRKEMKWVIGMWILGVILYYFAQTVGFQHGKITF